MIAVIAIGYLALAVITMLVLSTYPFEFVGAFLEEQLGTREILVDLFLVLYFGVLPSAIMAFIVRRLPSQREAKRSAREAAGRIP